MPDIASLRRNGIACVARKDVRIEALGLNKATGAPRTEIAALARRTHALQRKSHRPSKASAKVAPLAANEGSSQGLRFRATGRASQRQRFALSAGDCDLPAGASGRSVTTANRAKPVHRPSICRPSQPLAAWASGKWPHVRHRYAARRRQARDLPHPAAPERPDPAYVAAPGAAERAGPGDDGADLFSGIWQGARSVAGGHGAAAGSNDGRVRAVHRGAGQVHTLGTYPLIPAREARWLSPLPRIARPGAGNSRIKRPLRQLLRRVSH